MTNTKFQFRQKTTKKSRYILKYTYILSTYLGSVFNRNGILDILVLKIFNEGAYLTFNQVFIGPLIDFGLW